MGQEDKRNERVGTGAESGVRYVMRRRPAGIDEIRDKVGRWSCM